MPRRVRSGRTLGNRARLRVRGCKVSTYRGCRFRAVAAPLNASFFGHPPWIPRFRADSRRGASVRSGARTPYGLSIGGGWRGGATRWPRSRTGTGAGCRCRVPCRVRAGRGVRGGDARARGAGAGCAPCRVPSGFRHRPGPAVRGFRPGALPRRRFTASGFRTAQLSPPTPTVPRPAGHRPPPDTAIRPAHPTNCASSDQRSGAFVGSSRYEIVWYLGVYVCLLPHPVFAVQSTKI